MSDDRELLELAAEPLHGMSPINRVIAYSAAQKLRELGYQWIGNKWTQPEQQAEPERVPLTDEQIIDIREDCAETPLELRGTPYGWAINFARKLERAHGIV